MCKWQQPNTTRRYLHPPKAERVVTMWSEGKLMLGEVELLPGPTVPKYTDLICCGIWPVYGENDTAADFKTTTTLLSDRGIPVYRTLNRFGGLDVTSEAFCDTGRKPSCFATFSIKNDTDKPEIFSLLLRTGLEHKLIFNAPDVYESYAPDVQVWKDTEATWKAENGLYRDGAYFLKTLEDNWAFDAAAGKLSVTVQPGQQLQLRLIFGKGEIPETDYEAQKAATIKFYEAELARLAPLPAGMNKELTENLVIQLLQCFCAPADTDLLMCRQGGLQRRIWPFEAMYVLEGLDRLGSFDDYIEPVIDLYFNVMQVETGEIVPLGIYWAMATAVCLYSFGDHALRKGKAFYEAYRERAMAAFDYIKDTRVRESDDPAVVVGLFPPKRSCDAVHVLQAWTMTDTHNLIGLKKLAAAAKQFADPRAQEIEAEYLDYLKAVQYCFDRAKELSGTGPLLTTNYVPGVGGDETLYPFRPFMGIVSSVLELNQEDVNRILEVLKADNSLHEGLYDRMPNHYRRKDPDGVVREWYTTLEEYYWFDTFARLGDKARCQQIIDSTCFYSMTKEYHMVERYHCENPWFAPWSPNASANGRLLIITHRMATN